MKVEIRKEAFDPYTELKKFQDAMGQAGKFGATGVFIGTMRDFNEDSNVQSMYLEHYPGMTEKHLNEICAEAGGKWAVIDALVLHRVGEIAVSDAIVLVAVWSAHRGDAMDACRHIIEDLKHRAPFWKKEKMGDGERWVEKNTSGYKN